MQPFAWMYTRLKFSLCSWASYYRCRHGFNALQYRPEPNLQPHNLCLLADQNLYRSTYMPKFIVYKCIYVHLKRDRGRQFQPKVVRRTQHNPLYPPLPSVRTWFPLLYVAWSRRAGLNGWLYAAPARQATKSGVKTVCPPLPPPLPPLTKCLSTHKYTHRHTRSLVWPRSP